MKTVHENKLKEILSKYIKNETACSEIVSLVDDIVDDETYDAKNVGYSEGVASEASWHQDSDYYK